MLHYLWKVYYAIELGMGEKIFLFEGTSAKQVSSHKMKGNISCGGNYLILQKPQKFEQVPKELLVRGVVYEMGNMIGTDLKLVWCQKNLRFSYDDYLYFPLLVGNDSNGKNIEKSVFSNFFLMEGNQNKKINETIAELEKVYYNERCKIYVTSSDYFGEYKHEIVRNITNTSYFKLRYIDPEHITSDFDDEINYEVFSGEKAPVELGKTFNDWIGKLVLQSHQSGALSIKLGREALFMLLIYLECERSQPHKISFFHNDIKECCPHATAHTGVEEYFHSKYLQSNRYDHVYICYMKEEFNYRGFRSGECILSYVVALCLKGSSFEFVKYQFYNYVAAGDILS